MLSYILIGGNDGLIDIKELAAWMKVHHAEAVVKMTPEQVLLG